MSESRLYTRELNDTEKKWLKTYYSKHLPRKGFLSPQQKKRLLGLKRRERGTPDSDFWYKLKHRVQNVIVDLKLICDVASEKQLKEMFGEKIRIHEKTQDVYPMALVLISLLPSMMSADILKENVNQANRSLESAKIDLTHLTRREDIKNKKDWIKANEPLLKQQEKELQSQIKKLKDQEWRKNILEDVAVNVLQWYLASGIFQTDSHRRMIIDTLDAIAVMSSGKKMNLRHDPDQIGIKPTMNSL